MKIIPEFFNKWLKRSTLCFTLVMLGMSLAGFAVKPDSNALFCSQILYILLFSVLVGISFGAADFVKNNAVIRRAVQFVLSYVSFALTFYLGGAGKNYFENQSTNKAFTVICTTLIFIGIYVVAAFLVFAFAKAKESFANRNKKYEKQFDDVKNDNLN